MNRTGTGTAVLGAKSFECRLAALKICNRFRRGFAVLQFLIVPAATEFDGLGRMSRPCGIVRVGFRDWHDPCNQAPPR